MRNPPVANSVTRHSCPHCPYETNSLSAFQAHLGGHYPAVGPPVPLVEMPEMTAFVQRHLETDRVHWPANDEEMKSLATQVAGNLLQIYDVVPKQVATKQRSR